jgi:hypothetical protein
MQWLRRLNAQLDLLEAESDMRRSVGSQLTPSMMMALALMTVLPASVAAAATCGERIAALETKLRLAESGQLELGARESTAATMHRQPTPETIARAEARVRRHLAYRLKVASKLNSQGREAKCLAALGRFAADGGNGASQ